jgi:hypothetical protein
MIDDTAARNLLQHLADERDTDDPVGELARALLTGEHTARDLVQNSWIGAGLTDAVESGRNELDRMSEQRLAALTEAATRLHGMRITDEGRRS